MTDNQPAGQGQLQIVVDNPWRKLRQFTAARIGLGRSGSSIPTTHLLEFQLAHARAQDAVHLPLDVESLKSQLQLNELLHTEGEPLFLHSKANDRSEYLQRPDLGRRLNDASVAVLDDYLATGAAGNASEKYDLAVVIVDGLSSLAIQQNAADFLKVLGLKLNKTETPLRMAPLCIVEQGRVAIGDDVGERLNARSVLLLVGERPGLSSPDSMGLYFTWAPKVGLTDAARNCISNVRIGGLSYPEAAGKVMYLLQEASKLQRSGVALKDRSADVAEISGSGSHNSFLTPG